ncbi:hypothetical protein [Candidatus Stoquefichus sp. SB1]|uniref:hypothetical protein n=1 Tax=Candidatus Stoquefichus sp. SB1 TaxID=1658109 RepID=UPI00067F4F69|nr:hypothetical protein [Candidatus Stoquefichus sp. SB1]
MDKHKDMLNIIEQTINDTKYIKDSYQPFLGIYKILKYWLLLYTFSILSFFCIDKINMNLELYNYSSFYTIYNLYRIILCIAIPTILLLCILKSNISLKERKFLKIWLIFPVFLCLDNCLASITSFLNAEVMISFYQSLPISCIINIISLLYFYYYFKQKKLIILAFIYAIYCSCSFYFLSIYFNLTEINIFYTNLFTILNFLQTYKIVELLTLFITIVLLRRNRQELYER